MYFQSKPKEAGERFVSSKDIRDQLQIGWGGGGGDGRDVQHYKLQILPIQFLFITTHLLKIIQKQCSDGERESLC